MQKTTLFIAVLALIAAVISLLRPVTQGIADAQGKRQATWQEERTYPPLVFASRATLDCSISSTRQGRQLMRTVGGQGFNFDAVMLPIKDGKMQVKSPGMMYKFTAYPVLPLNAQFHSLGDGVITTMKAEVAVDVKRFQQPGGAGTQIHFRSADMDPDAAYIEFTGIFVRNSDHKRFPFRVVFGSAGEGSGTVVPTGPRSEERIMSKAVVIGTRQQPASVTTALYEYEEDVPTPKQ
jgi:hypothetical protein